MFIQSFVYVVLTILTATAAYAAVKPIGKELGEQHAPVHDKEATNTLQP